MPSTKGKSGQRGKANAPGQVKKPTGGKAPGKGEGNKPSHPDEHEHVNDPGETDVNPGNLPGQGGPNTDEPASPQPGDQGQ